jgi:hypothetical protein
LYYYRYTLSSMSPTTRAPKQLHTFRLSPETLRQIKALAELQGRTVGEVVTAAVEVMYQNAAATPPVLPQGRPAAATPKETQP